MQIPGIGKVVVPKCQFHYCGWPATQFYRLSDCGCPRYFCGYHAEYAEALLSGSYKCGWEGVHAQATQTLVKVSPVIVNRWLTSGEEP